MQFHIKYIQALILKVAQSVLCSNTDIHMKPVAHIFISRSLGNLYTVKILFIAENSLKELNLNKKSLVLTIKLNKYLRLKSKSKKHDQLLYIGSG